MIWDIAAGIIIGGGSLGLVGLGIRETALGYLENVPGQISMGWLMTAAGIGLGVWVIFFKAQFL